jgi:hypothetical protein
MVVGKTGTGKTVVINGVVMEAALRDWPVWICDPKRIEFLGMRRWANVQIVATTVEHMIAVIWHAWEEMEHRYALVEAGLAYEGDFEPLIVVLDEYRDLVGMVTDWYTQIKVKGMPAKCPVFEKVASLARKGRSARVHLVLGTQRPDAEFLGGEMRDNFDTRISLGRLSPQGAQMMWEAAYVGVAIPRGIPGRGTAVAADGRPLEVQSYWTPDPRRAARSGAAPDLALLDRLRPTRATHEALQVELPEELLRATVGEDGKPIPARPWEAVLTAEFVPSMEGPADESPRPFERYTADTDQVTESDPDAAADETDPMEGEELVQDDDYGPSQDIPVDQITEGDLILVDDVTQFWAVVESRERDLEDEDVFLIDWRTDDDEAGSLTIPDDLTVTARRPLDLDPEDAT